MGHYTRQCLFNKPTSKETPGATNKVARITPASVKQPESQEGTSAAVGSHDDLVGKVVDDVLVTLHGVTPIPQGDHSILGPIPTATVKVEGTQWSSASEIWWGANTHSETREREAYTRCLQCRSLSAGAK